MSDGGRLHCLAAGQELGRQTTQGEPDLIAMGDSVTHLTSLPLIVEWQLFQRIALKFK